MRNQSKTRQSADEACEFQLQPGFTAAQCVAHRMTPGGSRVQQKKKGGGGRHLLLQHAMCQPCQTHAHEP